MIPWWAWNAPTCRGGATAAGDTDPGYAARRLTRECASLSLSGSRSQGVPGAMTEEELSSVEDGLRTVLRTYAPFWVLREVDQTITEGVAEARYLQRRAASRYDSHSYLYEAIAPSEGEYQTARKNSSTLVISTRPMLPVERVRQLIDATRTILVELPEAEDEIVQQAIELSGGSPEGVCFVSGID